jgi:methyl-accepting chemotaxis protein/hemerythrin
MMAEWLPHRTFERIIKQGIPMARLNWTDEMSTGIAEQDEQHRKLIDLINRLNDAIHDGKDSAMLDSVLAELADYAVYHFGYEEELMSQYEYHDAAAHRLEHQNFVEWVDNIKKNRSATDAAMSAQVVNFLRLWVTGHIMKTDKKMGSDLTNMGAT